jgi:hypothetical protein
VTPSRYLVSFLTAAHIAVGAPPASLACSGTPVITLNPNARGSFDIALPLENSTDWRDGLLVLHGEDNQKGGWLVGVYRKTDKGMGENLVQSPNGQYTVESKIDIDPINTTEFPNYPKPLVLPIKSTQRSLCIGFSNVRKYGTGAASSFRPGSTVEFRIIRNPQ